MDAPTVNATCGSLFGHLGLMSPLRMVRKEGRTALAEKTRQVSTLHRVNLKTNAARADGASP